jgi:hypothetical protein
MDAQKIAFSHQTVFVIIQVNADMMLKVARHIVNAKLDIVAMIAV